MNKLNYLTIFVILVAALSLAGGAGMGNWGYAPCGWMGLLFMGLIATGLIVLAVFGVVWLVRNVGNSKPPSSWKSFPNSEKWCKPTNLVEKYDRQGMIA